MVWWKGGMGLGVMIKKGDDIGVAVDDNDDEEGC